jgi:hypothetical protein
MAKDDRDEKGFSRTIHGLLALLDWELEYRVVDGHHLILSMHSDGEVSSEVAPTSSLSSGELKSPTQEGLAQLLHAEIAREHEVAQLKQAWANRDVRQALETLRKAGEVLKNAGIDPKGKT